MASLFKTRITSIPAVAMIVLVIGLFCGFVFPLFKEPASQSIDITQYEYKDGVLLFNTDKEYVSFQLILPKEAKINNNDKLSIYYNESNVKGQYTTIEFYINGKLTYTDKDNLILNEVYNKIENH